MNKHRVSTRTDLLGAAAKPDLLGAAAKPMTTMDATFRLVTPRNHTRFLHPALEVDCHPLRTSQILLV
uniref:Uncharacterized protein n=1 Tax=Arundo donax TaxID=35708 RepID=A0A0A8YEG0_ARUDO